MRPDSFINKDAFQKGKIHLVCPQVLSLKTEFTVFGLMIL